MKKLIILLMFFLANTLLAQQFAVQADLDTANMRIDSIQTDYEAQNSGAKTTDMYAPLYDTPTDSILFAAFLTDTDRQGVLYVKVNDTLNIGMQDVPDSVTIILPKGAFLTGTGDRHFKGWLNAGPYRCLSDSFSVDSINNSMIYGAWTGSTGITFTDTITAVMSGGNLPGYSKYAEIRAVSEGTTYSLVNGGSEWAWTTDSVWIDKTIGYDSFAVSISNDSIYVTTDDEFDYAIKVITNKAVYGGQVNKDSLIIVPKIYNWGVLSAEIYIRH